MIYEYSVLKRSILTAGSRVIVDKARLPREVLSTLPPCLFSEPSTVKAIRAKHAEISCRGRSYWLDMRALCRYLA